LTATIACGPVRAAEVDLSQVDVISIVPRSPDVEPFAISVPAEARRKADTTAPARAESPPKSAQIVASTQSTVTRTETGKR